MIWLAVPLAALVASALSLFSGFGLGTILLPVFALFFPIDVAVAATAVVHLISNLFKLTLVGRQAAGRVVLRFGLPAIVTAWVGAGLLVRLGTLPPLATYAFGGAPRAIEPIKLVVAILMAFFAWWEWSPRSQSMAFAPRWLPLGGAISGFFGGLSGHQGAFRSLFLLRAGLNPQAFIATGVVIACLIDLTRLVVYSDRLAALTWAAHGFPITVAALAACAGAWIAARRARTITLPVLRRLVATLLLAIALGLATGLL